MSDVKIAPCPVCGIDSKAMAKELACYRECNNSVTLACVTFPNVAEYINQIEKERDGYKLAVEKIASEDYRGNRSSQSQTAYNALALGDGGKNPEPETPVHRCKCCGGIGMIEIKPIGWHLCNPCVQAIDAKIADMNKESK